MWDKTRIAAPFVVAMLVANSSSFAQPSNVSVTNKFSWSENCGWMNWRDGGAPPGQQGAFLDLDGGYLSGFVWCENTGWINLGEAPGPYGNASGADFGVNMSTFTGLLSGFAWGERVGWINFTGGRLATPARPATFDAAAGRLRGYAWGENIGWINLDDAAAYVAIIICPADFNQSGTISVQDIFDFLAAYFGNDPRADINNSGAISVQDIFDFLAAYFRGCP